MEPHALSHSPWRDSEWSVRIAAGMAKEVINNGLTDPLGVWERELHPAVWITWLIIAAVYSRWK